MSHYFQEDIYNEINQNETTFPTVEFTGYSSKLREQHMQGIFNKDQLELINPRVGKSTYFLNVFTELVKARTEDQTFE